MEKIKVSELFDKTAYHSTTADEELIKAVLEQSKKNAGKSKTFSIHTLIIVAGLITAGILLYNIYTIIYTDRFFDLGSNSNLSGDTLSGNLESGATYNPEWEKELLNNINTIFTE